MKLILLLTVFAIIVPQAKLILIDFPVKRDLSGNPLDGLVNFIFGPKGIRGSLSYDVGFGRKNNDKDYKDTKIKDDEQRNSDDDSEENVFGLSGSNKFDSDIFNSGLNGEVGIYSRNQENKRKQDLLSSFIKSIQNTKENDDSLKSINSRNRISGSGQFDAGFDLGNSGGINTINFLKTLQNAGFNVDDLSRYSGNFYNLLNNLAIKGDSSKLDKQKINEIILLLKLIQIFQTDGASYDLKQYFGDNAENFLNFIRSLSDDGHAQLNQVNSQDVSDYFNELQNIGKYDLSNIISRLSGHSFTDNVDNHLDKFADKWRNRQDEDYTNRQDDNSVSDFLSNLIRLSDSRQFDKLKRRNFGSRGSLGGSLNTESDFGKLHKALGGSANIGYNARGRIYDAYDNKQYSY